MKLSQDKRSRIYEYGYGFQAENVFFNFDSEKKKWYFNGSTKLYGEQILTEILETLKELNRVHSR